MTTLLLVVCLDLIFWSQGDQTVVVCVAAVDHCWTLRLFIDEEVEVVANQLHLGERLIDADRGIRVQLATHNLAERGILKGASVRVSVVLALRLLCASILCLVRKLSCDFYVGVCFSVVGAISRRTFTLRKERSSLPSADSSAA